MSDVEALLWEREGYKRRGLANRVAQVDAVLKKLGVGVSDAEVETADGAPAKRGRRSAAVED